VTSSNSGPGDSILLCDSLNHLAQCYTLKYTTERLYIFAAGYADLQQH